MQSPQERVYGVLDIVTKPIQWFIGAVKVLGFLLLVAVVAIVTPVYHLVTTGTASAMEIEIALFVIGLAILFLSAPWFTVLGGIALFATAFFYSASQTDSPVPSYETVRNVLWGFQLLGYLWVGAKHRRRKNKVYADSGRPMESTNRKRVHTPRPRRHSAPKRDRSQAAKREQAPDCYQVLGVQKTATRKEIKQAHRDLVKIWHPDRFSADDTRLRSKAEDKLREINEAFAHINSSGASDSADSVAHFVNVDDAIRYVTAVMIIAKGEGEDFARRFKAGEFAERGDLVQAAERMIARLEEVSAKFNDVVERIKRDAPDAVDNPYLVGSQQKMNQLEEYICQVKDIVGRI
jgi:energy-coupling factor transporter transmembrane protein EcfT